MLPSSFGMPPLILHDSMDKLFIEIEKFPMELGRIPFIGFSDKYIISKFLQLVKEERKLKSGVGDVKTLPAKLSNLRLLKLPNMVGIKPENELNPKSRTESSEMLVRELGIVPLKLFSPKKSLSRFGRPRSMLDGRLPRRSLSVTASSFSVEILKIEAGMRPAKLLD